MQDNVIATSLAAVLQHKPGETYANK